MDIDRNLHAEIAETKKEVHGRMRVGISSQRGIQLLPLIIPEFIKRYPYVKIELLEYGSDTLERLTAEGQCDLGLITTAVKPNRLNYVLIENEQVVLMAARSTELAHRFEDRQLHRHQGRDGRKIRLHDGKPQRPHHSGQAL